MVNPRDIAGERKKKKKEVFGEGAGEVGGGGGGRRRNNDGILQQRGIPRTELLGGICVDEMFACVTMWPLYRSSHLTSGNGID